MNTIRLRRIKRHIPGILPQKKWLSLQEACAYLDMSQNHFLKTVAPRLTISVFGNKKYFMASELNEFIESNILIQKN